MPRIVTWRLVLTSACAGTVLSLAVAWACAMWSPVRMITQLGDATAVMPNGEHENGAFARGFGWIEWSGNHRYAPVYRFAGWPAPAVWSRTMIQPTGIPLIEGEPRDESDRAA